MKTITRLEDGELILLIGGLYAKLRQLKDNRLYATGNNKAMIKLQINQTAQLIDKLELLAKQK